MAVLYTVMLNSDIEVKSLVFPLYIVIAVELAFNMF